MGRFVSSLYSRVVAVLMSLCQSDPYVRVLINDVVEGRTEVQNNSRSKFSHKKEANRLKYTRRS